MTVADPCEHLTAAEREWLKRAETWPHGTTSAPEFVAIFPALLAEVSRLRGALRGAHRLLLSSEWCDADPEMREIVATLSGNKHEK